MKLLCGCFDVFNGPSEAGKRQRTIFLENSNRERHNKKHAPFLTALSLRMRRSRAVLTVSKSGVTLWRGQVSDFVERCKQRAVTLFSSNELNDRRHPAMPGS